MLRPRTILRATLLLSLILAGALAQPASAEPTIEIRILAISDWHAQLDPLSGAGGASFLSTRFASERAQNPNTLTLTAGDSIGASPPLSGFFDDEPAIRAMNLMGFSADTFGNHNFDRGLAHLQRLIDLAGFPFLAANLENLEGNLAGVERYRIFEVAGVKVAVVGVVNPEAPTLVLPGSFGGIEVAAPGPAAMAARADAAAEGATVFVAIGHLGVTGFDGDGEPYGPLVDFANAVSGFDVILGDHTDIAYQGVVNGQLVMENRSKGVTFGRVTLQADPATGAVVSRAGSLVSATTSGVSPDEAIELMLAPYRDELARLFDRKIGVAEGEFKRGGNVERLTEAPIGNLVTDAIREEYGAAVAFNNGGGLRAALPSSYLPRDHSLRRTTSGYAQGPPFDLVVGDVYTALPFGNSVVTRNVTGGKLYEILENGVSFLPAANGRFAQVSGFSFAYDAAKPVGERVSHVWWHPDLPDDAADALPDACHSAGALAVCLLGSYYQASLQCPAGAPPSVCTQPPTAKGRPAIPVSPDDGTNYTLATNNFVAAGGDGYTMLADGEGVTRDVMADVVLRYIEAHATITPRVEGRIRACHVPEAADAPAAPLVHGALRCAGVFTG